TRKREDKDDVGITKRTQCGCFIGGEPCDQALEFKSMACFVQDGPKLSWHRTTSPTTIMAESVDQKKIDAKVEHLEFESVVERRQNSEARIRNPLADLTRPELERQVEGFCDTYGFEDKLDLFQKAALVAQRPEDYEDIEELTDEDKKWLRMEKTNRWKLPWTLYLCIAVVSLGSAIQGWDNTGANGANLSFPEEFGIADNEWLIGVINSAPTLFGLASAWAADPVNNWFGRRGTIFLTNLFVVFPVLAQAFTQTWQELMICRLFMGIGMGVKISTIPVYTAEVAPASIRGGLVTSFQLWVAFGILSPRWYLKKNRYQKAFRSFCRIRNTELQAAREMYFAHMQILQERAAFEGKSIVHRAWELFSIPRIRRATIASAWIVISQQFSGINIMAFYSSTIFSTAGYNVTQSLLASWGFGLVTLVFAFPAVYTMDTFGRRNLLLLTFPNMAWCLLAAGLCFLIDENNSARVPLIAFFVYLFSAFYGPGIGPIPSIYFSEAFPLSHRELGAAFTICVNNALGSALGLTFPSLLAKITPTGAFGFYAGLNVLAFVVIFFIIPETKQLSLEELDYVFGVPTTRHAAYMVRTWLPWWIRRWVLWKRDEKLVPLYQREGRH
ncbi:putative polyol transporter 2, partial [Pseudocercospora fuligena]